MWQIFGICPFYLMNIPLFDNKNGEFVTISLIKDFLQLRIYCQDQFCTISVLKPL